MTTSDSRLATGDGVDQAEAGVQRLNTRSDRQEWAYKAKVACKLSLAARAILDVLVNYYNDDTRNCYPSYAAIASQCNVSEKTVKRHLPELVDHDLICVKSGRRSHETNYYFLHFASTSCPNEAAHYPAEGTNCPSEGTNCPSEGTNCPAEGTNCPSEGTNCPAEGTNCPAEGTNCPDERTNCPTEPFPVEPSPVEPFPVEPVVVVHPSQREQKQQTTESNSSETRRRQERETGKLLAIDDPAALVALLDENLRLEIEGRLENRGLDLMDEARLFLDHEMNRGKELIGQKWVKFFRVWCGNARVKQKRMEEEAESIDGPGWIARYGYPQTRLDESEEVESPAERVVKELDQAERERAREPPAVELWDACLASMELQVSRPIFRTWLKDTKGWAMTDGELVIQTPSRFVAEWLEKRMGSLIENVASSGHGSQVKVAFVVEGDIGRYI